VPFAWNTVPQLPLAALHVATLHSTAAGQSVGCLHCTQVPLPVQSGLAVGHAVVAKPCPSVLQDLTLLSAQDLVLGTQMSHCLPTPSHRPAPQG
jgi:hypothetical protein